MWVFPSPAHIKAMKQVAGSNKQATPSNAKKFYNIYIYIYTKAKMNDWS